KAERWLTWDKSCAWQQELREQFARTAGSSVGIRGIPDRRVSGSVAALGMLQGDDGQTNAGQIRAAIEAPDGEDPTVLGQLSRELGAELTWRRLGKDGIYDAIFNPRWVAADKAAEAGTESYTRLANSPVHVANESEVTKELKDHLQQVLPHYMVPASIIT